MLDGVVRYPPDVVARYRAAGHWSGRSLWDLFAERLRRWDARVALVSGDSERATSSGSRTSARTSRPTPTWPA